MKATIEYVELQDNGVYLVRYSSGYKRRWQPDDIPGTVQAWLDEHGGTAAELVEPEAPAASVPETFEAPAVVAMMPEPDEKPDPEPAADADAVVESARAVTVGDVAWAAAFKALDIVYAVLGLWDMVTINGPGMAARAWDQVAALLVVVLSVLGVLGSGARAAGRAIWPRAVSAAGALAGWVLAAGLAGIGAARWGVMAARSGWALRSEIIQESKAA